MSKFTLTDEECKEIISKTKWKEYNCTYEGHKLTPFTEGRTGNLGEHYKLKIKLRDIPDELRFFVKRTPSGRCTNTKEAGFYGRIISEFLKYEIKGITNVVPQCYYVKDSEYIVLEDLASRGFKTVNPQVPLDVNLLLCGLVSLAIYHSASIIYELKKSKESGEKFDMRQCFKEELNEIYYRDYPIEKDVLQSCRNAIDGQVILFEDIVCKKINKENLVLRLTSLWDTIKNYVKPSEKYMNVICHGDLWQANLMFLYESDSVAKCILIDEQMIRYAPPALDVMSFLYQTSDRKLRQTKLNELLEFYYCALRDELYKYDIYCQVLMPKEEFLESCENYRVFAMLQAFNYSHVTHIPTDFFEQFMSGEDFKNQFLFVSRGPALKMLCKESQVYKERQLECLLDLVEYIESNG